RSLGIGYAGGSLLLLGLLLLSLLAWYWVLGSVCIHTVKSPKQEVFYWTTILFSQTLGTALGDWTSDNAGLGYIGSASVFAGALAILALIYCFTQASRTLLFWMAFILTRPLGAALGDFLDKPIAQGGLHLSRFVASAVLLVFIAACIFLFPHRAAKHSH
ncbi:MAG TPA: hypothetical protein PLV25_05255, partial [Opitutales bacterium]|nr:hypothetical protein [Opitutales bacterium]